MSRIALALLLLSLPTFAAAADSASADSVAPDESGGTAILLFLDYEGTAHPPFAASDLHSQAWDRLVKAARDRGIDAQSRAAIEPLVYKWRVRTSLAVSTGFVGEISSALHCPKVLIADLSIYPDRLILMVRRTITATGELASSGVVESPLAPSSDAAPDLERLLESVEEASSSVLRDLRDRPPAAADREVFFLPARRSGIDAAAANLAGCCFLRALLRTDWRVQDPGIAFTRLAAAGVDPAALDSRARPELAGPEGNSAILIGELASYGLPSGEAPLLEASEAPAHLQFPSVALSLRRIDARTGNVVFASTEFIEPPSPRGFFGLARTSSLATRIQPAADRLVAKIEG